MVWLNDPSYEEAAGLPPEPGPWDDEPDDEALLPFREVPGPDAELEPEWWEEEQQDLDAQWAAAVFAEPAGEAQAADPLPQQPPVKRARLRKKQPRPAGLAVPLPVATGSAEEAPPELPSVELPFWQWTRMARRLFCNDQGRKRTEGGHAEARVAAFERWTALSSAERGKWVTLAKQKAEEKLDQQRIDAALKAAGALTWKEIANDSRVHGALLTFNGPWLQDNAALIRLRQQHKDDPDRLVEACDKLADIHVLLDEFWAQMQEAMQTLVWEQLSCSVELSMKASVDGRVHLHAMATFPKARQKTRQDMVQVTFRGRPPSHVVFTKGRQGHSGRTRALREGHFYLQARKLGRVAYRTTWHKNVDFPIQASWIKNMWQVRKITNMGAKLEYVECRDRVHNSVADLEKAVAAHYRVHADIGWVAANQAWRHRPFKAPDEREMAWLRQYLPLYDGDCQLRATPAGRACEAEPRAGVATQRRFKHLIYDGPSGYGKTERAMHWFGAERTLVVNCQNILTPNLRELLTGRYKCVVFDEGNHELVSHNRAMFQASPRPIQLSQSQCNEAAYTLVLFMVPMIVCSNFFWTDVEQESKAWIDANSEYVNITAATSHGLSNAAAPRHSGG